MDVEVIGGLKFGECPPQQNGCTSDGMSSDATVLCIDSDAEDDVQSQDGFAPELDSRLQEKGLQGGPEPITRFQGSTVPPGSRGKGLLVGDRGTGNGPLPKFFAKVSDAEVLKETTSFETVGKVSWGREQDLADVATGAVAGQGEGPLCEGSPPGVFSLQQDYKDGNCAQSDSGKKKKGNKNKKNSNGLVANEDHWKQENQKAVPATCQGQANQQPVQQKGRRRGRRGGRGRKQAETEVREDIPKLEKSLEEELAEQLANQASNDSALSMGFSSIRLHVPGGNTMIILNDHELKDGTTPDDILEKIESSLPSPEETARRSYLADAKRAGAAIDTSPLAEGPAVGGPHHQKTASKGCGAFFPPALLKEMLNDPPPTDSKPGQRPTHRRMHTDKVDSMSSEQKLNIGAPPFMPFSSFSLSDYRSTGAESFGSAERQVVLVPAEIPLEDATSAQRARTGTGCFIPIYSPEVIVKREEAPRHVARESLEESLSNLDGVSFSSRRNRLTFQMPTPELPKDVCGETLFDDESDASSEGRGGSDLNIDMMSPRCPVVNNVGAVQGDCARVVVGELSVAERPDNPRDELMQLLEGSKFTSFTSPLHLEETLDGLQEEREARENAENRLVELEMENLKLRGGSGKIGDLQSELSKAQEVTRAMQVLLFVALAKPDKIRYRPKGMFRDSPKIGDSELAAVRSKLIKRNSGMRGTQNELERRSSKSAVPKKDVARRSVADGDSAKSSARKLRSVSSSDLKPAGSRASHTRALSAGIPAVSKVMSVRAKVTEITKTTTTTKLTTTTEETTTTKERKTVKKASTTPLPVRKSSVRWH